MLARITRGSKGLAEYLRTGRKQDSTFLRCDKDKIIPLYGNLNTFEKMENYLVNNETYKNNYIHITLSFNKEDTEILNSLEENERINALQEMTKKYIRHHTTGYDEEEFVAYAEVHSPIIKEENNKERLEHIHIGIALYNGQDYTKLQTPFFGNGFMDNVLQTYVNKKFHLNLPTPHKRYEHKKEYQSKKARDRGFYKEQLKDIASKEQLLEYFRENNVVYKEVHTKNNHYFKVITQSDKQGNRQTDRQGNIKDINLRGKDFSHIEKFMRDDTPHQEIKKNFSESNADKSLGELGEILEAFHEKQFHRVYKRRSAKSKLWFDNRMKGETMQEYSIETLPSIDEVLPHIWEIGTRPTSLVDLYIQLCNKEKERINIDSLHEVITNSLTFAESEDELEEEIKNTFNVKYCRLDKEVLEIDDQTVLLSDLGFSKLAFIDKFRENRESNTALGMDM